MSDIDADRSARELAAYARHRDELLVRIVGVLDADPHVRAAWLSGSFGRGEADAYVQVGRPVLVQPEMQSNAQSGAQFQLAVFDGPLEVDWNIGPLSQARRPATSHILRRLGCCMLLGACW